MSAKTDQERKKWLPYKYIAQKQLEIKITDAGQAIPKTDKFIVDKLETPEDVRMTEAK